MKSRERSSTLYSETVQFMDWLESVIAKFRQVDAFDTWSVILSSIFKKLTSVVAFFLPLKVILLLGSDGVPRYFRGFISDETRNEWIVFLAFASVAMYLVSLLLGLVERRRAMIGSGKVLQTASEIALFRNQENIAESYYSRFCSIYANFIFAIVLVAASFWMMTAFGLYLVGLVVVEWLLVALVLGRFDKPAWSRGAAYLRGNTSNFLTILASINFLLVFGFLIVVFLYFGGLNILIAILIILVSRQFFSNISGVVGDATKLSREERKINSLVFTEHAYARAEAPERYLLRKYYNHSVRVDRLAENLDVEPARLQSNFTETGPTGINIFDIVQLDEDGAEYARYCELVFGSSKVHLLENEDVLFRHMNPAALGRPELVCEYEVEGFQSRVFRCDRSGGPPVREWNRIKRELLARLWNVKPSKSLVDVFSASRQHLHQRVTVELLQGLEIALESKADWSRFHRLSSELEAVCAVISRIPLVVLNPKLSPNLTVAMPDGRHGTLGWGAWLLAPVGAGIDPGKSDIEWLREYHKTSPYREAVTPLHMELAALVWDLESRINQSKPVSAKALVPRILAVWEALSGGEKQDFD